MAQVLLRSAVSLLGDAPQLVLRHVPSGTNYPLTIAPGQYFQGDLIATVNALMHAAVGWSGLDVDNQHRTTWSGGATYTLRLSASSSDAPYIARATGWYGPSRALDYYATRDIPALSASSLHAVDVTCGYDHVARDGYGLPELVGDLRVAASGYSAYACVSRRDVLDVTLQAIPGAQLSGAQGGTVTVWDVLDLRYADPLLQVVVRVGQAVRVNGIYALAEAPGPESVRRRVDLWSGHYDLSLRLIRVA